MVTEIALATHAALQLGRLKDEGLATPRNDFIAQEEFAY